MINIDLAKKYCCEDISKIENCTRALKDSEVTWHIHHKLGEKIPKEQLMEDGMYYDRPASELIFLHPLEHKLVHHPNAKFLYMDEEGIVRIRENTAKTNRQHGKGYLYRKRNRGCWRVRWTINGKRHDVSTGCLDRDEADEKAIMIISSVGDCF